MTSKELYSLHLSEGRQMRSGAPDSAMQTLRTFFASGYREKDRADSVVVAFMAMHYAKMTFEAGTFRQTVWAYKRHGTHLMLLPDSLQIVVLRWAATSYLSAGDSRKARRLAMVALTRSIDSNNSEWIVASARCLSGIDQSAVEEDFRAAHVLTFFVTNRMFVLIISALLGMLAALIRSIRSLADVLRLVVLALRQSPKENPVSLSPSSL